MNYLQPSLGELVVCRITKVLDYGVFVELLEYPGVTGFVHISQVASSWIKNIRNFVKENQYRVAQVQNIDTGKNQLDLSFTKVGPSVERQRMEQWKQAKRNQKILERLAKENKWQLKSVQEQIAKPLVEKYSSLQEAFQAIFSEGEKSLGLIEEQYRKPLLEILKKNIEVQKKTVRGVLALSSIKPAGVQDIKKALLDARASTKDAEIEIYYSGSGKYMVRVSSESYKVAERVLKFVSSHAIKEIESLGGKGEFEKSG